MGLYKTIIIGFFVFASYFFVYGEFGIARYYDLKQEISVKKVALASLKKEILYVAQELRAWKSDPFYLEKMAREDLGMGYKNEFMYLVKGSYPR
jgi:cell division protein FtsB